MHPFARLLLRAANRLHVALLRASRGRVANSVAGTPLLVLTTTGRRTGQLTAAPLGYLRDGDAYVVIASAGGLPADPGWARNLRVHPMAQVEIGGTKQQVHAQEVGPEEHAAVWKQVVAAYPVYAGYSARAGRVIPLFRLRPVLESVRS